MQKFMALLTQSNSISMLAPCCHHLYHRIPLYYSDKTAKLILGKGADILSTYVPIYHFFLNPFSLAFVFITKCNWLDIILQTFWSI